MATPFIVERKLTGPHLAELRGLLLQHATTIDDAMAWLADRGYRVSHGAVGNYRRRIVKGSLFRLRAFIGCRTDEETRRSLIAWIAAAEGDELTRLALYAAFLTSVRTALADQARGRITDDVEAVPTIPS
jgi:hypothetical protein